MICVICQGELCDNRSHELSECGHYFHANCIISWFRAGHKICPICRDSGTNQPHNRYRSRKHRIAYFKRWAHIKKVPEVIKALVDRLKKEELKMKNETKLNHPWRGQAPPNNELKGMKNGPKLKQPCREPAHPNNEI